MYLYFTRSPLAMDIPKNQSDLSISTYSQKGVSSNILSFANIVDIEQLNLEPGKSYSGRVIDQLATLLETNKFQAPADLDFSKSDIKNNWIMLLQGKLINLASEKSLTPNQILTVTPENNSLKVINTLEPNLPLTSLPSSKLSTTQLAVALNAMNQLLSKQVTLDLALSLLSTAVTQPSETTNRPLQQTIQTLISQLPQKSQFIPAQTASQAAAKPNTQNPVATRPNIQIPNNMKEATGSQQSILQSASAPRQSALVPESVLASSQAQRIKTLLESSGGAFEASLSRAIEKKPALVNEILQQLAPSSAGRIAPAESGTSTKSTLQSVADRMQSLIQNARQLNKADPTASQVSVPIVQGPTAATTSGNPLTSLLEPNPQTKTVDTPSSNLKELLLSLASTLSNTSDTSPKARLDGLSDPELLQNPFHFPPQLSNSLKKAEAFLADQELSTGQLLKLMASMINRIQFNQLNSLYQGQIASNETTNVQSWFFELPIIGDAQQAETFNIRIDKEESNQEESDKETSEKAIQWKIALSFDFEQLGAIYIQANITPPSISSAIWANNSDTLALINKEQHFYRQRLSDLGLEVGDICCQFGQPKVNKAKLDRNLVDINA